MHLMNCINNFYYKLYRYLKIKKDNEINNIKIDINKIDELYKLFL